MRLTKTRRGVVTGLAVGLLTVVLLNLDLPGSGGVAAAQDEPTPTPIGEETPTPAEAFGPPLTFDVQVLAELPPEGDLDADGAADPGDTILYTIQVTNIGESPSGPVEAALLYDATFIGATTGLTEGADLDSGQVTWTASFEPGEQRSFSVSAKLNRRFPPGRTQVQATGVVRSAGAEVARNTAPIIEVTGPSLQITDVAFELITDSGENGLIDPGDSVRFIIGYNNTGGGHSPEVSVVADYPDALTQSFDSVPEGALDSEGRVTWLVGSVPADGEVKTLQFTATLASTFPAGTVSYDLVVSIQSGAGPLDERTVSVPIAGPNLVVSPVTTLVTDSDTDGLADAGDLAQVTIQVTNVGTEPAQNVAIEVAYDPNQVEAPVVSEGGSSNTEDATLSWAIPVLEAEGAAEVSFQARVRELQPGTSSLLFEITSSADRVGPASSQGLVPADSPPLTPTVSPTGTPSIQESRPAQGQGILGSYAIALLIGAFLVMSLLAIVYVASRVLPGTAEERESVDTLEERADYRRMVRELMEGIILTAILFSVMILGLQNALDQDSVNSIIAGIVGYVAGRVASSR